MNTAKAQQPGHRSTVVNLALLLAVILVLAAPRLSAATINGVGLYRDLGQELFLTALKLDTGSRDPGAILASSSDKAIEIRFLEQMSERRWRNYWTQSIAINNSREALLDDAENLGEVLAAIKGPLLPGDQVELTYSLTDGTAIRVNGTTLTRHPDSGVFKLFLSALVGPVPPSRQFRQWLLGREDSSDHRERFEAIAPTPQRIDAIAAWIAPPEDDSQVQLAQADEPTPPPAQDEIPAPPATPTGSEIGDRAVRLDTDSQVAMPPRRAASFSATDGIERQPAMLSRDAPADANTPVALERPRIQPGNAGNDAATEEHSDLSVQTMLAQQEYLTAVIRQIYSKVSYPDAAVNRGYEDSVRAVLHLNRDGSVDTLHFAEESRFAILNQAVARAIEKAAPYPPIPETLATDPMELVIPVSFQLTR